MARNRKRAKERRARRPQPARVSRPGVATARPDLEEAPRSDLEEGSRSDLEEAPRSDLEQGSRSDLEEAHRADLDEAPSPLEHAAPDVELADAQVALGRPELADDDDESDQELEEEFEDDLAAGADAGSGRRGLATLDTGTGAAEPRRVPGNRLIHFLQGSWHELQRVQWPDRRQVVQATGVVIGFVIVAGVFLGVADALAGKLMNLILK